MVSLIETVVDGRKALVVTDDIPEGAPAVVREGLARRRLVWTGAGCPCGARMPQLNRAERRRMAKDKRGGVRRIDIEHEPDCPAVSPELERWDRR